MKTGRLRTRRWARVALGTVALLAAPVGAGAQVSRYVPGRVVPLLFGNTTAVNPADGATVYVGATGPLNATEANIRIPINDELVPGVVRSVILNVYVTGTLSSGEDATVKIRKNATGATDITLSTAVETNAAAVYYEFTDINLALRETDYVTFVITFPTYATNPTNVFFNGSFTIEVQR